jgi:hypothetical protein
MDPDPREVYRTAALAAYRELAGVADDRVLTYQEIALALLGYAGDALVAPAVEAAGLPALANWRAGLPVDPWEGGEYCAYQLCTERGTVQEIDTRGQWQGELYFDVAFTVNAADRGELDRRRAAYLPTIQAALEQVPWWGYIAGWLEGVAGNRPDRLKSETFEVFVLRGLLIVARTNKQTE